MSSVVLDASAALVLLNNEPGADYVEHVVVENGAVVSIVNWAEVLTTGMRELAVRRGRSRGPLRCPSGSPIALTKRRQHTCSDSVPVACWPDGPLSEHRTEAAAILGGQPPSTMPLVVFVSGVEGKIAGFRLVL